MNFAATTVCHDHSVHGNHIMQTRGNQILRSPPVLRREIVSGFGSRHSGRKFFQTSGFKPFAVEQLLTRGLSPLLMNCAPSPPTGIGGDNIDWDAIEHNAMERIPPRAPFPRIEPIPFPLPLPFEQAGEEKNAKKPSPSSS